MSEERASEIASIREEIFREFEEQKKAEIMETLEEAKEAWMEESEEQKREEVNEAMAYLESEYNKNLEEFKHKTLRDALEQARKQWTTEELSHREEILKVNVVSCVNHIKGEKLRARALRFLDYGENKIVLMKREVLFCRSIYSPLRTAPSSPSMPFSTSLVEREPERGLLGVWHGNLSFVFSARPQLNCPALISNLLAGGETRDLQHLLARGLSPKTSSLCT